ncbi:MAG: ribonuclease HIII [Kiritimatiellaceae bacterium]|nr:ribonuclease HIII [Kiritimatiellaceae bacterium]
MQNSYTFQMSEAEQEMVTAELSKTKYKSAVVPHTLMAASIDSCRINLYKSGKLLVQGKGAKDWVEFILEPNILKRVVIGYDEELDPQAFQPHMGIDESGKGDYFGPLVIASAYTNAERVQKLREIGVQDSKRIRSDRKILALAKEIRNILNDEFALITIGPAAYNRMYEKIGNVNKMLAWGHARAIENLLDKVPDCPRALSDKFGPSNQIKSALMEKGAKIELEQKTKAESDPAVAAASILARAGFVMALKQLEKKQDHILPKGASDLVQKAAQQLIEKKSPSILMETAKCHFKTTDKVLSPLGYSRADISITE